jgi:hypothetical protein
MIWVGGPEVGVEVRSLAPTLADGWCRGTVAHGVAVAYHGRSEAMIVVVLVTITPAPPPQPPRSSGG